MIQARRLAPALELGKCSRQTQERNVVFQSCFMLAEISLDGGPHHIEEPFLLCFFVLSIERVNVVQLPAP